MLNSDNEFVKAQGICSVCDVWLRRLTEINLTRITKGAEKDGYAIIGLKSTDNSLSSWEETKKLKTLIKSLNYSYLCVYSLPKGSASERKIAATFTVVLPYDTVRRVPTNYVEFFKSTKSAINQVRDDIRKWNYSFVFPGKGDLLYLLKHFAGNNDLYIEMPPSSMQVAHGRWTIKDLNHIYKELDDK